MIKNARIILMNNKKQAVCALFLLPLLLVSATACSKSKSFVESELEVESMSTHVRGGRTISLSKKSDPSEIGRFVNILLKAKRDDPNMGTTHPVTVRLTLANGKEIIINGGTQGFQTVLDGDEQFNISGEALDGYFQALSITSKSSGWPKRGRR